uniref:KIAA1737 n=1 Tax=Nothobranchius kadleci TaxID=1051664 RepID=A0A1A8D8A7_NOTKA
MSIKRKAEIHLRTANRPCIMKSGGSQPDSERDSGFSDASSEHTRTMDSTDSEDAPRPVGQLGSRAPGSGPRPSQVAVVGGAYSGLSPMIIMNNVLLKQPVDNPPALKPWGFSPTVEVVQQPQVVFLQPVVSRQTSPSSKAGTSRHRRSKKYLPILKSYPKIAPHPGDSSSSSGRGTASSSSSSSSSSSRTEKCSALTSTLWEHSHREKTQRTVAASTNNSGSASLGLPGCRRTPSPVLPSSLVLPVAETGSSPARERPSSAASLTEFTTSLSLHHSTGSKNVSAPWSSTQDSTSSQECNRDNDSDAKRKRFCNTYNILSKSGLLDITLRTKELLRQNQSTQNDLDRLRRHTDLFLQALQSGDTSICVKLLASLQEEEKERALQTSSKPDQTHSSVQQ